jgi:hypothetical protein
MVKQKKHVKKRTVKKTSKKNNQLEQHNRILKGIFGIFIVFAILIGGYYTLSSYISNFTYEGVDFEIVKEGELIFYKTSLPVIYQDESREYDFYLRNDPRKLVNIQFYGQLHLIENMVLNATASFNCEGDGPIAIANLVNLYNIMGAKIIRDENATCYSGMEYSLVNIQPGNTTYIDKTDDACYQMYINDCEILEATERFMVQTLVELQTIL